MNIDLDIATKPFVLVIVVDIPDGIPFVFLLVVVVLVVLPCDDWIGVWLLLFLSPLSLSSLVVVLVDEFANVFQRKNEFDDATSIVKRILVPTFEDNDHAFHHWKQTRHQDNTRQHESKTNHHSCSMVLHTRHPFVVMIEPQIDTLMVPALHVKYAKIPKQMMMMMMNEFGLNQVLQSLSL